MLKILKAALGATFFSVLSPAMAEEPATLEIAWPVEGAEIVLGDDAERAIAVFVKSSFSLKPAGRCGEDKRCGHIHLKIDPDGDTCNIPGRPYNSMNSDFGSDLIKARFGHCPSPEGKHVIGALLADDHHKPVLVNGKPVTALLEVSAK
jgi:hypothetical protein